MAKLTPEGYLYHLTMIQKKLDHFVELVSKGETHYFTDIAQQLRILFLVRSSTDPLIHTICNLYSLRIKVFVTWTLKEQIDHGLIPESLTQGLVAEINNNPAQWFDIGHEMIAILDAINRPEQVTLGKNRYSIADIIGVYADKLGGAHIDEYVQGSDLKLHDPSFQIGGLSVADRILFDAARSSVKLIDQVIRFIESGEESKFIERIE